MFDSNTTTIPNALDVFLGGSCTPATWSDVVIPALAAARKSYYNPTRVDKSSSERTAAKANSDVLLFVIDSQTRGVASIQEATEDIRSGRKVVLVINNIDDGTVIDGQVIGGGELKDLNRARADLADIAMRNAAMVFTNVNDAVDYIVKVDD